MATKNTEKRIAVSKKVRDSLLEIKKENKLDSVNSVLENIIARIKTEKKEERVFA